MRFVDYTYPDIESNLALDEALLIEAEDEGAGAALRLWEFPRWAVVLGASCRLRDDVDMERCAEDRVILARRSSGGGTVLIGPGALNVTVVLPMDAAPGLSAVDTAQAYVLERLAECLRERGLAVELKGSADLTLGGRKFSGSAQRRLRRNFLVHSSVLYDVPIDRIARYLRPPPRQPAYREGRSHEDFLTNLPMTRAHLAAAVRSAWGCHDAMDADVDVNRKTVEGLVAEKFGAAGWVERL